MTKTTFDSLKLTPLDLVHANKNGEITLTFCAGRLWARTLTFYGGPYRKKPPGVFGVNLKAEDPNAYADVYLPIRDFGTPTQNPDEITRALRIAFEAAAQGSIVWFGCAGGIGRTGTALALLASASSDVSSNVYGSVSLVRERYLRHAVETEEQMDFVADFDPEPLKKAISSFLIKAWIKKLLWPF